MAFVARLVMMVGVAAVTAGVLAAPPKPYRLPDTDLKQRVIWGSTIELPDGRKLSFGGQDQEADDGQPHTQLYDKCEWKAIHAELRNGNEFQKIHDELLPIIDSSRQLSAKSRRAWFSDFPDKEAMLLLDKSGDACLNLSRRLIEFANKLTAVSAKSPAGQDIRAKLATENLNVAVFGSNRPSRGLDREHIKAVTDFFIGLEQAAEPLDAEPAGRALSPLVFEPKSGLVVLFGGDHLDYLTNDTWVFDPKSLRWTPRQPKSAPAPRANHTWKVLPDGKLLLSGGYTYTSSTDYTGGQYVDLGDGDWTYDVAANEWTGAGKSAEPGQRVYRTGPLHPNFFLDGPPPDRKEFAERLANLPDNTWVATGPPRLPKLNRDWGTAVLDPDRDLILRYSGGHSAHGGTDVLHYHLNTNRWELSAPVEFPLGQLYSNTSYPEGVNFNLRPWITGHTYQNYGYDPIAKKMLFTGRDKHTYFYDPDLADWQGRFLKPAGMAYDSCFYTLTLCATPQGLVAWTNAGLLFRFDAAATAWQPVQLSGEKLPDSSVDNSTIVFDSKRSRLLAVRKPYGDKESYDGQIYAVDFPSGKVSKLSPAGMAAASAVPYLCQLRYDETHDLLLVGGTLPPDADGLRRTPAFDCAANAWISLKITGTDPSGPRGRNVSLGMMYDAKRKLFWAVDTDSKVFVLRLKPEAADRRPL